MRYHFALLMSLSGNMVMMDGMIALCFLPFFDCSVFTKKYCKPKPFMVVVIMRQMPYILPEDLIPWLMNRKLWPEIPQRKIKRYWNHLRDVKSDIANSSADGSHHPIWIWGDAANYAKDQNILVICFGSVLDDATDSITKCFPLVLLREEPCKQFYLNKVV